LEFFNCSRRKGRKKRLGLKQHEEEEKEMERGGGGGNMIREKGPGS